MSILRHSLAFIVVASILIALIVVSSGALSGAGLPGLSVVISDMNTISGWSPYPLEI